MTKLLALLLALVAAPARATLYTLTVSTTGPNSNAVITSSNPTTGIHCGAGFTRCAVQFSSGAVVTLTEVAGSTVVFAGWTYARGCRTNLNTCKVTMSAAANVEATFNPVLAVRLYGNGLGAITSSDTLVNCSYTSGGCARGVAATFSYKPGSVVILQETAGSSSTFVGWSGSGGCSTASTCTLTLNGYTIITATFSSAGPFTLAVKVFGSGRVVSSPSGIRCGSTCAAEFAAGTPVSLSTLAASGYYFAGWANGGCSGTTPCVVTSSSTQQGLGGAESPAAYFYPTP